MITLFARIGENPRAHLASFLGLSGGGEKMQFRLPMPGSGIEWIRLKDMLRD